MGLWPSETSDIFSASTGRGFLIVGAQRRGYYSQLTIVGARADDTGHPIGPIFVILSSGGDDSLRPVGLASDGRGYLLIYVGSRGNLMLACLDEQGTLIRSAPIPGIRQGTSQSVVWSGSAYVLATAAPQNSSVIATVIDSDGTVVRSTPLLGPFFDFRFTNAPTDGVVITWYGSDLEDHVVTAPTSALRNGTFVVPADDANPFTAAHPGYAAIASSRRESLIVWPESGRAPIGAVIHALRLDRDGHPAGAPFVVAQLEQDPYRLSVVPAGNFFVITYFSNGAHVITDRGTSPGTGGLKSSVIALSGGDSGALLLWGLEGAFIGADGVSVSETRNFSAISMTQSGGSVRWCGNGYRAVWQESTRSGDERVMYGRIDSAGRPMDVQGREIEVAGTRAVGALIACNESNSLVMLIVPGADRAAVVEPDGTQHPPFEICSNCAADIQWNGFEYLAWWENGDTHRINLRRIARDGSNIDVVPRELPRVPESAIDQWPSIAWNGAEYLVAWNVDLFSIFYPHHHAVYAVRLSRDLNPIGTVHQIAAPAAEDSGDELYPFAMAGESEWGLAWSSFEQNENATRFVKLTPDLDIYQRLNVSAAVPVTGMYPGGGTYRFFDLHGNLLTIEGGTVSRYERNGIVAMSQNATPLIIVSRETPDERLPRLYVIAPPGVTPPVRRRIAGH